MKLGAIFTIILITSCLSVLAQSNMDKLLEQIEKNNSSIKAWAKSNEASKSENKSGIYLENPEVGFGYLWGNPSVIGNRMDFSITQSFDFPTAYGLKKQIAKAKNDYSDMEFQKQRKIILLNAKLLAIELIYYNALAAEYNKRLKLASQLAVSYKTMYEIGESNVIEYNKARLNFLNISKDAENAQIEKDAVRSQLVLLNGGNTVEFADTTFQIPDLPDDFEQWYAEQSKNIPELLQAEQESAIGLKQQKLMASLNLPKFNAGYMSEKTDGEQFQGITFGISIPLWQNKNTLKYSKARILALQSAEEDAKTKVYNALKTQYQKIVLFKKSVEDYRTQLQLVSNLELLKKALDKGELNLIEFILEQEFYYDSFDKLLQMERELNKGVVELMQFVD